MAHRLFPKINYKKAQAIWDSMTPMQKKKAMQDWIHEGEE
jgi:hypothetical protein